MNTPLSLLVEELDALADYWAGKIGQGDEAAYDMACKRIRQLEAAKHPDPGADTWLPSPALTGGAK